MTAAHLDYDALADLAEGILDEATATSAEVHLSDCVECRDRAAEVAEVSRVLAEAPIPPMPADLVERLDAAIAAEAAARPPHLAGRGRSRRLQYLAAAAAAVVVVGGGGVVARTVLQNGDSRSARVSQPPVNEPSRSHAASMQPRPQVAKSVPYTAVHSGRSYTSDALRAEVITALAASHPGNRPLSAAADGSLDGCVNRVSSGRTPLLVDSAAYEGKPATIIVLPGTDARHADVWVVGTACSAGRTDALVHRQIAR